MNELEQKQLEEYKDYLFWKRHEEEKYRDQKQKRYENHLLIIEQQHYRHLEILREKLTKA